MLLQQQHQLGFGVARRQGGATQQLKHQASGSVMMARPCAAPRCADSLAARPQQPLPLRHRTAVASADPQQLSADAAPGASNAPPQAAAAADGAAAAGQRKQAAAGAASRKKQPAGAQGARTTRKQQQQQLQQGAADEQGGRPIVVAGKPASQALLRRLQEVPQTVIRAARPEVAATYRTLTTIAAAQRQLAISQSAAAAAAAGGDAQQQQQVLVYVPWTRWRSFIANVLPVDAALVAAPPGAPMLTVGAGTAPAALAATLAFDLVRARAVMLRSAGPAAAACAAEACRVARAQLLGKGYELGVVPSFVEGTDKSGGPMTVLHQLVVVQQLAPPQIIAPRGGRSFDTAAAAGSRLLQSQGRLAIKVPDTSRLTELLHGIIQQLPAERGRQQQRPQQQEQQPQEQQEQQGQEAAQKAGGGKRRLLLLSTDGTTTTMSSPGAAPGDALRAAAAADSSSSSSAEYASLSAVRSRFTAVPEPRQFVPGPDGSKDDCKAAFAAAASSASGLASAIGRKLSRVGAAWLQSDGSAAGNAVAWDAVMAAARAVRARDRRGGLLVLVDVASGARQPSEEAGQQDKADSSAATAADAAAPTPAPTQAPAAAAAASSASSSSSSSLRLSMLIMRDDEVASSILQAPNTPLETSGVSPQPALDLLKFAAAANCFLPQSRDSGAGGLVILPAVLASSSSKPPPAAAAVAAPAEATSSSSSSSSSSSGNVGSSSRPAGAAPDTAVDYRFAGKGSQLPLGSFAYAFRLQRATAALRGGVAGPEVQVLRVSNTTDAARLRDAIVAKVLEGRPAALRFVGPATAVPASLAGTAMTAVAAARVRLQQKASGLDVGMMPFAESLIQVFADEGSAQAAAAPAATAPAAAAEGDSQDAAAAGPAAVAASRRRQQSRVVWSLRLVPLPAPVTAIDAIDADAAAPVLAP